MKRARWVWSPDSGSSGSPGRIPERCGRRPNVRALAAPWAPGALSPAERTALAPRGRAWLFLTVPGQQCNPVAYPGSRDFPGAAGGGDTERERRRRPLSLRVRGAREERKAGWPRASVRARPESYEVEDPRPERPAWPLSCSQRRCCTDTHPPSTQEHPPPPLAAAVPRAVGPSAKSRAGAAHGAPLDIFFSPSLQPSLIWAAAAAGGWGLHAEKGGDDRGRLLFFLKDAFASSQCVFCEPSY